MWGWFFGAMLLLFAVMLVPGFFFFKAFGFNGRVSLAAAPIVPCFAVPLLGILYTRFDVDCSWQTVLLPVLAACLGLYALSLLLRALFPRRLSKTARDSGSVDDASRLDWAAFAGFIVFGILVTGVVFILNLDGPDSFVQEYDNVHHLARIETFSLSGDWSCFVNAFYPSSQSAIDPVPSSGAYYPSAWHSFAAICVNALDVSPALAANATNAAFVCLVFPCGCYLLSTILFSRNRKMLACFAVCSFAFAAFPWKLMYWGPLFPNLASLCLLPAVSSLFIALFLSGVKAMFRIGCGMGVVLGLVALLFLQPNAIFTGIVFLVPYCVYALWSGVRKSKRGSTAAAGIAVAVFAVFVVAFWVVAFNTPTMQPMVTFSWPAFTGKFQAVVNVLLLSLRETPAQLVLALLVIVGFAKLAKDRDRRWLCVSYALLCFLYVVSASTNGQMKQFLTGFWYTDFMRLAANVAIAGIPLAAAGAMSVCQFAAKRLPIARKHAKRICGIALNGLVVNGAVAFLAMSALLFCPSFEVAGKGNVSTGIGSARVSIEQAYSVSADNVLNPEERSFLQDVEALVGEDDLIVNEPNDGSAFAYSLYGMNVYYRAMDGYGGSNESVESKAIRGGIDDVDRDEDVRDAVRSIGAKYLLQLDQGDDERSNRYFFSYYDDVWAGIDAVDDETPGFEKVLSEGDMRLYRIVG